MNKRVCILRSNPVKPDSRVEKEAACLAEAGYEILILSWDRDGNHAPQKGVIKAFGYDIPIIWFGHKAAFGAGLKSLKSFLLFQSDLFKWLKKYRKEYDIIHACDFDTAFTARQIQKFYHKKLIFDIFDFICGEPKNLLQKIVRNTQNKIINNADATIICTEQRKKQIRDSSPKKLAIVHNTPPKVVVASQDISQNNKKIKVCYVGILQEWRLLEEIPKFFIEHSDFELHIAGFGKYEEKYQELAKKYSNIIFYGRIPYTETLELEASCDIMLAIYDPKLENHRFAAPNKFYESLMLAKPVVMAKGTGMSDIVEENQIGVTIDYDIKGFSKGLLELASQKAQWYAMKTKMSQIYNNTYCWDEMKRRLINLYSSLD